MGKFVNFLYSEGCNFGITKLHILIFCNILHLEMGLLNLRWKGIVSSETFRQKSREKHYKWDIGKNGIAYSMTHIWKQPTDETSISIRIIYNNTF